MIFLQDQNEKLELEMADLKAAVDKQVLDAEEQVSTRALQVCF